MTGIQRPSLPFLMEWLWTYYLTSLWHSCACACSVAQLCQTLCDPMDCSPPGSSVHGISQAQNWSGLPFLPLGDLPNSGIEPTTPVSPALAGWFFTTESPGKPLVVWPIKWGYYNGQTLIIWLWFKIGQNNAWPYSVFDHDWPLLFSFWGLTCPYPSFGISSLRV